MIRRQRSMCIGVAVVLAASCGRDSAPELCAPARSPLRRLTYFEYNNTVRDLLGDTTRPADAFPPEETMLGFTTIADAQTASELLVGYLVNAAATLAKAAVADPAQLLGCSASESGCVAAFVERFGRRAYRRPLVAGEAEALLALYQSVASTYDGAAGVEAVLQAILQSPHFLYRVELGTQPSAGASVLLTQHELATRLSYLLWATTPDDALLDAAEHGELDTPERIAEVARRMLDDPRARAAVAQWSREWLEQYQLDNLTKDAAAFPAFDPALAAAWQRETATFTDHVIWDGSGTVAELLSAPYSFLDARLRAFYGLPPGGGAAFEQVALGPEHKGLLTQAAFLATHAKPDDTSPILRGVFVRERILCQELPPPPPFVQNIETPTTSPDATLRQQLEELTSSEACSGCHSLINPVGFAFERYDGIGAFRTVDAYGHPLVTSGDLTGAGPLDGPFASAIDLVDRLAHSDEVRRCVALHWFRYGYGRQELAGDQCTIDGLDAAFAASQGNIRELLVALTQTDAFRYRTQGE